MVFSLISQLANGIELCSRPERQVRTTLDAPLAPEEALTLLKDSGRAQGEVGLEDHGERSRKMMLYCYHLFASLLFGGSGNPRANWMKLGTFPIVPWAA